MYNFLLTYLTIKKIQESQEESVKVCKNKKYDRIEDYGRYEEFGIYVFAYPIIIIVGYIVYKFMN